MFLQELSTLSWHGTLAQCSKCSWGPWLFFSSKTLSREPSAPCTVLSRRGLNLSAGVTSPTALWEKSVLKLRMTLQQRSCGSSVRDCVVLHKKLSIKFLLLGHHCFYYILIMERYPWRHLTTQHESWLAGRQDEASNVRYRFGKPFTSTPLLS